MNEITIRMMQLGGQGFYCSQILLIMALETRGQENPDLVRSVAGLAYGCGSNRGTCGVLSGGSCLLGLYAGKGGSDEIESDRFFLMLQELGDWFEEQVGSQYGGITCESIVGEAGPAASRERCGRIVADTYGKCLEILQANDIDPTAGPEF